jgi:hypothetical protein
MSEIEFKQDDVVRIVKQPEDHHVYLRGKVGVVDEVSSDAVLFIQLTPDGGCGGAGVVPKSCIELVTDPKWIHARDERERKMNEHIATMDEENRKRVLASDEAKKRVGEEFGIEADLVESIVASHKKALSEELDRAGVYKCY